MGYRSIVRHHPQALTTQGTHGPYTSKRAGRVEVVRVSGVDPDTGTRIDIHAKQRGHMRRKINGEIHVVPIPDAEERIGNEIVAAELHRKVGTSLSPRTYRGPDGVVISETVDPEAGSFRSLARLMADVDDTPGEVIDRSSAYELDRMLMPKLFRRLRLVDPDEAVRTGLVGLATGDSDLHGENMHIVGQPGGTANLVVVDPGQAGRSRLRGPEHVRSLIVDEEEIPSWNTSTLLAKHVLSTLSPAQRREIVRKHLDDIEAAAHQLQQEGVEPTSPMYELIRRNIAAMRPGLTAAMQRKSLPQAISPSSRLFVRRPT